MAHDPTPSVGYGRPPKETRFRKGQSGNPKGKVKGTKSRRRSYAERLGALMLEEAYRPVIVNEDGKETTLPMAQVVFRSLAAAAAKGEARAQATFLKLVSDTEEAEAAIAEMFDQARENEATEEEPVTIVTRIVDAANGRPTGKTEIYSVDTVYPSGKVETTYPSGNPAPKGGSR